MNKRIIAFIMSFCILISPLSVYAYNDDPVHNTLEDIQRFVAYIGCQIGCLGTFDYTGFISNMETYNEWCNNGYVTVNDDGSMVASDQMVDDLKEYLDSYIEDHGDYYYLETYTPDDFTIEFSKMSAKHRNYMMQLINSGKYAFSYWDSFRVDTYKHFSVIELPMNNIYFVAPVSGDYKHCMYFYNSEGEKIEKINCSYANVPSGNYECSLSIPNSNNGSAQFVSVSSSNYQFTQWITPERRKVKVWKSSTALKYYLRGAITENKIYTTSVYNNYDVNNDNSVTINKKIVEEVIKNENSVYWDDITNISSDVTNVINNYYTSNGSSMSQQEIQNAIDAALQKFLDSLPSGGGEESTEPETPTETETETETETGGDISGNDVSGNGVDGPKTVGLLTKIYNKLSQIYNLLKGGILDALNGIKSAVSGGGVSGNDVSGNGVSGNDAPSDDKSWFEKIYDKLSEIKRAIIGNTVVGGLGDLLSTAVDKLVDLADTVKDSVVSVVPEVTDAVSDILDGTEETIGKMVDNVGTNFRPVGDKMKTKFPFSIPWDIAAVVGSLSAAPETPVFEIPIVFERYDIDYTLTIDMADFEVISKISRLFLSLTFVLFLTKLTIQVVKMEKEL